jgi:NurA-like 5'-3' nuclease
MTETYTKLSKIIQGKSVIEMLEDLDITITDEKEHIYYKGLNAFLWRNYLLGLVTGILYTSLIFLIIGVIL